MKNIQRSKAEDIIKKYGGRITSAPSSKTSYVILGDNPGPKKLQLVNQLQIKTLNEDEFIDFINSFKHKKIESKSKLKPVSYEKAKSSNLKVQKVPASSALWTEKYKPEAYSQVIGNKANLDKLITFLKNW